MASNHQMTQKKRNRERNQVERREEKAEKKESRKDEKAARQALKDSGIDPDLMDIVPGPQPPTKW